MSTNNSAIDKPKKTVDADWHKADVIAAIKKKKTSLQREARLRGYYPTSLHLALDRPWPKAERIIAVLIGLTPQDIWPSRYDEDGAPKSGRGQRGLGRIKAKDSTGNLPVNVHNRRAA